MIAGGIGDDIILGGS
ncbi:hypothetical protein [Moraxella bovis]